MSLKAARPHRRPLKPSLHVWNPNDSIDMGGTYGGAPPPGYTSHANEVCPPSARSDDGTSGCHGIDDDGARGFAAAVTFSQSPHTTAESAVQVMRNNVHSSLVPASSSREADYYSIPTTSHTLQTDIRRRSTYSHVAPYRPSVGRRASASHRYTVDNFHNQLPSSSLPFGEYTASPNGLQSLQPGMDPRLLYSMSTGHLPELPPPIVLHPPPQARARATNFVSLARKNTLKRTTFSLRRKPPNVFSITGDFTIDPALKVPLSLLKSREPSQHDGSASSGRAPISSQGMKQRKNLSLEVENGGIDVDINLVSCTINKRGTRLSTLATPLDNRPPSSLSMAYTTSGQLQSSSSLSRQPSTRTANLPAAAAAAVTAEESALSSQVPTLIDLRLKGSTERSLARSGVKRSRKAKEAFPLVARIHAPNPRPPFHLLASVVDIDSRCTPDQSTIHPPLTPNNTYSIRDFLKHSAEVEVDHPPITRLPKSNISLHLPRTFHGPLTVHVLAGDIDQHVHLSEGISEAAALLSEDAFSRTYFIGDLDSESEGPFDQADFELISAPAELEQEDVYYKKTETGTISGRPSGFSPGRDLQFGNASSSSPGTHASSSNVGATTTRATSPGLDMPASQIQANQLAVPKPIEQDNNNTNTWRGDKIDVVVGRGHIHLQFVDESEPFGRKLTFWKSIFRGGS